MDFFCLIQGDVLLYTPVFVSDFSKPFFIALNFTWSTPTVNQSYLSICFCLFLLNCIVLARRLSKTPHILKHYGSHHTVLGVLFNRPTTGAYVLILKTFLLFCFEEKKKRHIITRIFLSCLVCLVCVCPRLSFICLFDLITFPNSYLLINSPRICASLLFLLNNI